MTDSQQQSHNQFSTQIDAACDALEAAWQQGETPDWRHFMAGNCTDEHQLCCADLIAVDMEWRLKAELPVRAEDYLEHIPGEPSVVIRASIVAAEFTCRRTIGDDPRPEEYFQRFPELTEVLSSVLTTAAKDAAPTKPRAKKSKTTVTAEEFTSRLSDSGLVASDEVRRIRGRAGLTDDTASGAALAKFLVKEGRLTKYQAQRVYNNKAKNLVMGSYVILDRLGEGGMGHVFKARHRRMKRDVALKVLAPKYVKDEGAVQRFHREVEAAARLNHPNVVTAHDADEARGTHYLVMEYVRGQDLSELVKTSGRLTVAVAVEFMLQAATGLAYAHSQGVIHRDIKPSNLLLESSSTSSGSDADSQIDTGGQIKILDMGLARFDVAEAESDAASALTGTGTVMGTVDYMAPEQAMDSKTADHRSDIYSLGATLHFLVVGEPMYAEDTVVKRIMAHQNATIPSLHVDNPALQQLFERMVAKQPEDRIQPTEEVVTALQTWLDEFGTEYRQANSNPSVKATEQRAAEESASLQSFSSGRRDPGNSERETENTLLKTANEPADDTSPTASAFEITTVPSGNLDGPIATETASRMPSQTGVTLQGRPSVAGTSDDGGGLSSKGKLLLAGVGGLAAIVLFAVLIFRFPGKAGTVVVELDGEPAISAVEIDGRAVTFSPDGSDKRITFKVDAGSHELSIKTDAGLELTTSLGKKRLDIKSGKNVSLRAWVERHGGVEPKVRTKVNWLPGDAPSPAIAPFDGDQAKKHQEEWAEYLGVPTEITNEIGMRFRLTPPGEFQMGASAADFKILREINSDFKSDWVADEIPSHAVRISLPFYISTHEVTNKNFVDFVVATEFVATDYEERQAGVQDAIESKKYPWKSAQFGTEGDHPVVSTSWGDAVAFCTWLSRNDGATYQLPTEAQWEYGARAGTTGLWWNGNDPESLPQISNTYDAGAHAWMGKGSGQSTITTDDASVYTAPVGRYAANPFGLFDMTGNAKEWCVDAYDKNAYTQRQQTTVDPITTTIDTDQVFRGGSWLQGSFTTRVSARGHFAASVRSEDLGFRVVRLIPDLPWAAAGHEAFAMSEQPSGSVLAGEWNAFGSVLPSEGASVEITQPGEITLTLNATSEQTPERASFQTTESFPPPRRPQPGIPANVATVKLSAPGVEFNETRYTTAQHGTLRIFDGEEWLISSRTMDLSTLYVQRRMKRRGENAELIIGEFVLQKKSDPIGRPLTSNESHLIGRWDAGDEQLWEFTPDGWFFEWTIAAEATKEHPERWTYRPYRYSAETEKPVSEAQDPKKQVKVHIWSDSEPASLIATHEISQVDNGISVSTTNVHRRTVMQKKTVQREVNGQTVPQEVEVAVEVPEMIPAELRTMHKSNIKSGPWIDPPPDDDEANDHDIAVWVLQIGGTVEIEKSGEIVTIDREEVLPPDPIRLSGISLEMNEVVNNETVRVLARAKHLTSLALGHTNISHSGVAPWIGELTNLTTLTLWHTNLEDQTLFSLSRLTHLEELNLNGVNLTDDGLDAINELKSLKKLQACETEITDSGLKLLENLTALQQLAIEDTLVSKQGLAALQAKLPNCRITPPNFVDATRESCIGWWEQRGDLPGTVVRSRDDGVKGTNFTIATDGTYVQEDWDWESNSGIWQAGSGTWSLDDGILTLVDSQTKKKRVGYLAKDRLILDGVVFRRESSGNDNHGTVYGENWAPSEKLVENSPADSTPEKLAHPDDLSNLSHWLSFSEDGRASSVEVTDTYATVGETSLKLDTDSGEDTGISLNTSSFDLDISKRDQFVFSAIAKTTHAWQMEQPVVVLRFRGGSLTFTPERTDLNTKTWTKFIVPISGDSFWKREVEGDPELSKLMRIEIHHDIWNRGLTVYYDGMSFERSETKAKRERAALGSDERKELLNLLRSVIRVDTGRTVQVNAINDFLKTPSSEQWSDVRNQAMENRTKLRTVITQIEKLNGDFVVDEMETYRQLMIDLNAKAKVYDEVLQIEDKEAPMFTDSIRKLAEQHSALIQKLQTHESAIQKYLQAKK